MRISTFYSKALLVLTVLAGMSLQGCVRDKCNMSYTHAVYTPVYMTESEFIDAVGADSPQEIQNPGKIYLKDNLLFVNETGKGVHIIDNKNPESPTPLAFFHAPGNYDINFNCDKMYLDSGPYLLVVDMSDASNPRLISRIENALPHILEYKGYFADPSKGLVAEWVQEIKTEDYNCETGIPAVWELNQVDPATLAQNGSSTNTRGVNPATAGKAGSMSRFAVSEDHLYIVLPQQMITYDVSNCETPTQVSTVELELGQFNGQAEMITTLDNNLLIGSTTGMAIYSNENPSQPQFLSVFQHAQACDPIAAANGFAYVTLRNGDDSPCGLNFTNQLDVVDISNPSAPMRVATFTMTNPHGLSIDANTLFIADGSAGLKVFDAKDPYSVGKHMLSQFPDMDGYDVITHENILILVGKDGIAQYDYSNLDNIRLLSTMTVN